MSINLNTQIALDQEYVRLSSWIILLQNTKPSHLIGRVSFLSSRETDPWIKEVKICQEAVINLYVQQHANFAYENLTDETKSFIKRQRNYLSQLENRIKKLDDQINNTRALKRILIISSILFVASLLNLISDH